jgi:hypothetical protein
VKLVFIIWAGTFVLLACTGVELASQHRFWAAGAIAAVIAIQTMLVDEVFE